MNRLEKLQKLLDKTIHLEKELGVSFSEAKFEIALEIQKERSHNKDTNQGGKD